MTKDRKILILLNSMSDRTLVYRKITDFDDIYRICINNDGRGYFTTSQYLDSGIIKTEHKFSCVFTKDMPRSIQEELTYANIEYKVLDK